MATDYAQNKNVQLCKAAFDKIPKEKRDRILNVYHYHLLNQLNLRLRYKFRDFFR